MKRPIPKTRRQTRQESYDKVYGQFANGNTFDVNDLATLTGLTRHTVVQQLRVLENQGKVYRNYPGIYSVTHPIPGE